MLGDCSLGVLGIGLAFGLALLAMMYVVGPISGCHLNPAVTLALLLARRVSRRHALYAVIGQVIGAIIGAALVLGIASGRDGFERGAFGSNGWDRDGFSGLGATIVAEILFTALLVLVDARRDGARASTPRSPAWPSGSPTPLAHLVDVHGRRHRPQPGPQPRRRRSSPTPIPTRSASSGRSSCSR